jgi:inner membrane protein
MDSISQAALGAAVGVAVMGRRRPVWQSALTGAVIGTLPDLDVLIDKGDEISDMVLHRAETHAFFWQALAAPLIAAMAAWVTRTRALYLRWWLLVLLVLLTHSMLDAMTVYGTRVGLPFTDQPFGIGSLFIIDPAYTLPLLAGLLLTFVARNPQRLRWNTAGLALSTLYAGWSVVAQGIVTDRVMADEAIRGAGHDRVLVTPTPFNTLLWRIVVIEQDSYLEGFHSLLDPPARPIRFERLARGGELEAKTARFDKANMIRDFSHGFYALADDGKRVSISDLRMGQHPHYAFSFAFAEHQSEPLRAIEPLRFSRRIPLDSGLDWLWRRLQGEDIDPPR